MREGEIRFGLVYAPARDELFAGGSSMPATLNGAPVKVHAASSLKHGLLGVGHSPRVTPERFMPLMHAVLRHGGMFVREGSGALGLCYAACGRLIGFIELHIYSWDCLAGIAILRAAGMQTNDFLADDGLRKGNLVMTGTAGVYTELQDIHREITAR
jgi:myo-inositol-1(or 4)-monophosphatase